MRRWHSSLAAIFCSSVRSRLVSMSAKSVPRSGRVKESGLAGGEELAAHFHEVGVMAFFVDDEIEFLLEGEEFLFLGVLVEGELGLFQQAAHFGFLHEAHELAVARLAELELVEQAAGAVLVAGVQQLFGLGGDLVAERGLAFDELFDERLVFVELVGGVR